MRKFVDGEPDLTREEIEWIRSTRRAKEIRATVAVWFFFFVVIVSAILFAVASLPLIIANHKVNPLWNW